MPSDFRILGPVEVAVGGTRIPVGGPKTQVLLITLLLHTGRRVSLARLAEALWDDQPPASAIANLRTYAAELRGRLAAGDDVSLVTRDGGYALDLGP